MGCENGPPRWLSLGLEGLVPEQTAIRVSARVAETQELLDSGQGTTAGPFSLEPGQDPFPVDVEVLPNHRFMVLSFNLRGHQETTPLLRSFNVAFQCLP